VKNATDWKDSEGWNSTYVPESCCMGSNCTKPELKPDSKKIFQKVFFITQIYKRN
jgi:hypothetical protein